MSPWRFSPCRRLALVTVLFACAWLLSCAGATRMPVHARGPAGAQIQAGKLDMSFLETPVVQQKNVADKLASIDTGYRDPHLFWGRWADSKGVAASPGAGAGGYAGAGNAKRIWHVKNLLVTFDDSGVMQRREVIDDDRVLWRRLHEHVAAMPPLDLSQPELLSVDSRNSLPILLHKEYFEVTPGKRGPVRIAPTSVLQLTHDSSKDKRNNAGTTCHTLHLAEKTSAGKNIHYCGSAEKVMTLFRYLQETGAKTMQWE
jgi:hypothetical protein